MSSYERIGPDSDEEEMFSTLQRTGLTKGKLHSLREKSQGWVNKVHKVVYSRDFLKALVLGQTVSLFLCGTSVFSGLLQEQGVNTPTAQSFLNYCLLCLVYTVMLACRRDPEERHLGIMLREDGWKYAILALIDVEANYLVVKAYSYTTITSVQVLDCCSIVVVVVLSRWLLKAQYLWTHLTGVLDCCSIVVVVVLSRWLLKARYQWTHLTGVAISLAGLSALVAADVLSGRNDSDDEASNKWLGDVLVIGGAALYGVSNVGQEFVVKNYPRADFLGMVGLFGSLFSGVQFILLERNEVAQLDLTSFKIWAPWLGYVACLFLIYTCMTWAIQQTSATTVNISILSADFYALIFGLLLFHYQFNVLYIVAFVLVIVGVAVYSARPVGNAADVQPLASSPSPESPQIAR